MYVPGGQSNMSSSAVFCFTGKSPKPRKQMEAMAIKAGGSVTKSVTNSTTILVIADPDSTSAKAQKARAMGVELISPEEFFEMCLGSPSMEQVFEEKPLTAKKNPKKSRHSSKRRIQL